MPSTTTCEYGNPDNKPLDQLFFNVVEDGVNIKIPALDKRWIEPKLFSRYITLLHAGGKLKSGTDLEEWVHEADWFRKDMLFLLRCKHHEFWSYMVYEKSALVAVISFLQRANPFYVDIRSQLEDTVIELYEDIRSSVLRIICRLVTNRESPKDWISKEHMRELLYNKFLISIPMLLDLIVIVGDTDESNTMILSKIFESVITLEPKYKTDLTTALSFFKTAFRTIHTQSENEGFDGAGGGPVDENLDTPYDDVVLFTLDTAYTLSILLDVCQDAPQICCEVNLGQSIAQFYDNTIPYLYKNIYTINNETQSLNWLNMARVQLLRSFRSIANSYLMAVLTNPQESLAPSEDFIGLLTLCLSEPVFVVDYQHEYPVELDMDILRQACKKLDNFKADFVTKGYQQEAESLYISMLEDVPPNTLEKCDLEAIHADIAAGNNSSNAKTATETQQTQQKRNIDSEVAAALDILPHLGTGFLRRVLSRYENSEDAIAAILEENLPPDLVNADRTEVYIPADPQDALYNQTGIKRFNVYDGDSYDIMVQDNPSCIIKRGKGLPNAPKNALELLDDKRDIKSLKHRYEEYSVVVDEVDDNGEYDDEYDDSYEALLESETRSVHSKQLKAGLADVQDLSEDESDDESDDAENKEQDNNKEVNGKREKPLDFCENPEVIRARYEARRALKKGSNKRNGLMEKTTKNDVVGATKGQGQNKDTLRNRHKKEVHKSSRANHNRKAGAAFKRSRGMVP